MMIRPTSVTVIAWILLVSGGITAVSTLAMIDNPVVLDLMSKNPIPIPIQYAISIAGLSVMFVSGIAMLKGHNWSRFLYVIWSAIGLLIGVVTSPIKATLVPGLVFMVIIIFFLFRPKANEYFSPVKSIKDE